MCACMRVCVGVCIMSLQIAVVVVVSNWYLLCTP